MSQLAIDFEAVRERETRREAMNACLDAADRKSPEWSDVAFSFLERYARANEWVFGEDVTKAAEAWGLVAPNDKRAWGGVYVRAQHAGIIKDEGRTRRRMNGSIAANYKSLVYRGPG